MTRRILFVQGAGAGAHDDWDSRLVRSLARDLGPDHSILYPRMPDEADPKFAAWSAALREAIGGLGEGAVLVGHSIGATILIHTLAQVPPARSPAGLFLISAPFIGQGGWPSDEIAPAPDLGARLPACPIHLYHGEADDTVPASHLALYAQAIPRAVVRALPGRDHQLNDDLSEVAADIRALG